jgi:hypothetical protein
MEIPEKFERRLKKRSFILNVNYSLPSNKDKGKIREKFERR